MKPSACARKVLQHARREDSPDSTAGVSEDIDESSEAAGAGPALSTPAKHLDLRIDSAHANALAPTTSIAGTPSEVFVFNSIKQYKIARALFSNGYSSGGSPRPEDGDIKSNLRWNHVIGVLVAAPVSCIVLPMKGVSIKIIRPARNGGIARSVVLHKPHGKNPRCEREVLENFATAFKQGFGWEKDGFVLGSVAYVEEDAATPDMVEKNGDGDTELPFFFGLDVDIGLDGI